MAKKNPAAVALGRAGGKRGGPARAARLTPAQRSESARNAVKARWAKARKQSGFHRVTELARSVPINTSDGAMLDILKRIRSAKSATEIRRLSRQLERVILHKQRNPS
jgi:hypothetical protein